jgi:hypothetical protein
VIGSAIGSRHADTRTLVDFDFLDLLYVIQESLKADAVMRYSAPGLNSAGKILTKTADALI